MKRLITILPALLLLFAGSAAADDLSAELNGAGGSGFASIITGNGTVDFAVITNGIGNIQNASIRQGGAGGNVVVNLTGTFDAGAGFGSVNTNANLEGINNNPGNFFVVVNGSGGSVSGSLANAGSPPVIGTPGSLQFASVDVQVNESEGTVTLTVSRTGGTAGAVSVNYLTTAGTAGSDGDGDFVATSGTLGWADGDGEDKSFTVTITDDAEEESAETFTATLSDPAGGATLGSPNEVTVTIIDNDFMPFQCIEDATTLCLADNRFQVQIGFINPNNGEAGIGQAVELTPDTGYNWFFNAANVEVVIKVLDACSFADRFWVFAGGLTNVETEIVVTDSQTGAVQTYTNPAGTPFQPVQDTAAFATCP
jgi:hypothetical protein